jgi:hypothetical protein
MTVSIARTHILATTALSLEDLSSSRFTPAGGSPKTDVIFMIDCISLGVTRTYKLANAYQVFDA